MESTDYLVILLSIGMSVVLLFTSIALYYLIKVFRSMKNISEKAENIADNVETASTFVKNTAGPTAVAKMVANMYEAVKKNTKDKK